MSECVGSCSRLFADALPHRVAFAYHSSMLMRVEDLHISFETAAGLMPVVESVSFDVGAGRTVALVGESGCGKSVTALGLLGLLPPAGRVVGGRVLFEGRDLLTALPAELRRVRGRRIAMVFQEPLAALNPVLSVGVQIGEVLRIHRGLSKRAARRAAVELLRRVGIRVPEDCVQRAPHELSGGMRQRAMIAMAVACAPSLLIADEPTTALDVTVQQQVLELLRTLQHQAGMGMLFITHDLSAVAEVADDVCVMYSGRIVEQAPVEVVLRSPRHPYTQALLACAPRLDRPPAGRGGSSLPVIPGEVPRPDRRPAGCAYHPRCVVRRDDPQCVTEVPPLRALHAEHRCACWHVSG